MTFGELLGRQPKTRPAPKRRSTATVGEVSLSRFAAIVAGTSSEDLRAVRRDIARALDHIRGPERRAERIVYRKRLATIDRELAGRVSGRFR